LGVIGERIGITALSPSSRHQYLPTYADIKGFYGAAEGNSPSQQPPHVSSIPHPSERTICKPRMAPYSSNTGAGSHGNGNNNGNTTNRHHVGSGGKDMDVLATAVRELYEGDDLDFDEDLLFNSVLNEENPFPLQCQYDAREQQQQQQLQQQQQHEEEYRRMQDGQDLEDLLQIADSELLPLEDLPVTLPNQQRDPPQPPTTTTTTTASASALPRPIKRSRGKPAYMISGGKRRHAFFRDGGNLSVKTSSSSSGFPAIDEANGRDEGQYNINKTKVVKHAVALQQKDGSRKAEEYNYYSLEPEQQYQRQHQQGLPKNAIMTLASAQPLPRASIMGEPGISSTLPLPIPLPTHQLQRARSTVAAAAAAPPASSKRQCLQQAPPPIRHIDLPQQLPPPPPAAPRRIPLSTVPPPPSKAEPMASGSFSRNSSYQAAVNAATTMSRSAASLIAAGKARQAMDLRMATAAVPASARKPLAPSAAALNAMTSRRMPYINKLQSLGKHQSTNSHQPLNNSHSNSNIKSSDQEQYRSTFNNNSNRIMDVTQELPLSPESPRPEVTAVHGRHPAKRTYEMMSETDLEVLEVLEDNDQQQQPPAKKITYLEEGPTNMLTRRHGVLMLKGGWTMEAADIPFHNKSARPSASNSYEGIIVTRKANPERVEAAGLERQAALAKQKTLNGTTPAESASGEVKDYKFNIPAWIVESIARGCYKLLDKDGPKP
jgi:hypothetical protein